MKSQLLSLIYEIELQPGEAFVLPHDWVSELGAGRWKITIEPVASPVASNENIAPAIRNHSAFLNSYVAADEGLYDHVTG